MRSLCKTVGCEYNTIEYLMNPMEGHKLEEFACILNFQGDKQKNNRNASILYLNQIINEG